MTTCDSCERGGGAAVAPLEARFTTLCCLHSSAAYVVCASVQSPIQNLMCAGPAALGPKRPETQSRLKGAQELCMDSWIPCAGGGIHATGV